MTNKRTTQQASVQTGMDRRAVLAHFGLGAAAGVACYTFPGGFRPAAAEAPVSREAATRAAKPVVSVFMDMPYVDTTGTAEPYIPPKTYGLRAELKPEDDFGKYHFYV